MLYIVYTLYTHCIYIVRALKATGHVDFDTIYSQLPAAFLVMPKTKAYFNSYHHSQIA